QLSLLMLRWRALVVDYQQWQARSPEITSTNPDVLLELGKRELQKVKNDLEMVLSTVRSKNKQLEEDLKREQRWFEEQEQLLDTLNKIEEEKKTQVEQLSTKSGFDELKNKMLKLKTYKKELLNALGEFLDEHFPLPEKVENVKNKVRLFFTCFVNFLNLIILVFQILINKLMTTPHEPYVTINESFWPPYIELLLRYGMALRHPEDPNRMRLEAFHK
ncbi:CENPK protein, partial [Ptilonorhynchus violaceus]|nr:CENPK protein [Ptilonorhynchus violaceus]